MIHDDIIQYIMDTLNWIPSKNPALSEMPSCFGINYHGITLLDEDSSKALKTVFTCWRDLFQNSPKVLKLRGGFVFTEGERCEGEYESIIFNRDEIINQFDRMISFAERLTEGKFYLYHCGV